MNKKNEIKQSSDTIRVAAFGIFFLSSLFIINTKLPEYLITHPPVCEQEGVVEEILALSGNEAKIKLQNGSIVMQKIKNYDSEKKGFKNQLKVNQNVCVKYENNITYKVLETVAGYSFR